MMLTHNGDETVYGPFFKFRDHKSLGQIAAAPGPLTPGDLTSGSKVVTWRSPACCEQNY